MNNIHKRRLLAQQKRHTHTRTTTVLFILYRGKPCALLLLLYFRIFSLLLSRVPFFISRIFVSLASLRERKSPSFLVQLLLCICCCFFVHSLFPPHPIRNQFYVAHRCCAMSTQNTLTNMFSSSFSLAPTIQSISYI